MFPSGREDGTYMGKNKKGCAQFQADLRTRGTPDMLHGLAQDKGRRSSNSFVGAVDLWKCIDNYMHSKLGMSNVSLTTPHQRCEQDARAFPREYVCRGADPKDQADQQ